MALRLGDGDVSAPLASLRSATITLAPSARKRMTVARPMPLAPPVTIATFPASLLIPFRPPNAWWSCAASAASLAFRINNSSPVIGGGVGVLRRRRGHGPHRGAHDPSASL